MISRRRFTCFSAAMMGIAANRTLHGQTGSLFRHGVASGDPLINRVILWTRVTPAVDEEVIPVEWTISRDASMSQIAQQGLTYTNAAFDYTVKVDVTRLDPGATYYYRFAVRGATSPIGRTKTLPLGGVSRLRLAVASCSNYPFGFFNAYRSMAERTDLDAVIHLGDYIYEYQNGQYGDGSSIGRIPDPDKETVTLADYRRRYAQYRADPDLQEAHRQNPWIIVYDDHESANDSWMDGAENHTESTEGAWAVRRAAALQAWNEWQPVREQPFLDSNIYRSFRFGNLADLTMLDTRLTGRSRQVAANSPAIADPNRSLLGPEQEGWFYKELSSSQSRGTRWRLVGQQTLMGQVLGADGTPFNPDQWDGYLASRLRFLQYLGSNAIGNVVVLTGDLHSSWGNEIAANPFGAGFAPQAVEFAGPGITSPAIEDAAQAAGLEAQLAATHPHVKYVNLLRRGYFLLDVDRERAQAEWYHARTLVERSAGMDLGRTMAVASGTNRLTAVAGASAVGRGPELAR
ncbi:MAG: alkaline phosphatase D family protein [Bryobacteraceae bacterium]